MLRDEAERRLHVHGPVFAGVPVAFGRACAAIATAATAAVLPFLLCAFSSVPSTRILPRTCCATHKSDFRSLAGSAFKQCKLQDLAGRLGSCEGESRSRQAASTEAWTLTVGTWNAAPLLSWHWSRGTPIAVRRWPPIGRRNRAAVAGLRRSSRCLPRHPLPHGVQILGGINIARINICSQTIHRPSRQDAVQSSIQALSTVDATMHGGRCAGCKARSCAPLQVTATLQMTVHTAARSASRPACRRQLRASSFLQVVDGLRQPLRVGERGASGHVRVAAPRIQRQRLRVGEEAPE